MMTYSEGLVSLNKIRVFARHGVLDQERLTGGEFVVSVVVKTDFSKALLTDAVDDTVNYAALLDIVRAEMAIPSRLLEHVAGRIAAKVCESFPMVSELWVEIEKVSPPLKAACRSASVKIHVKNI